MRQWKLFLSRFLLGLWMAFFSYFLFLTVSETRGVISGSPLAEVSLEAVGPVREIALPGRIFTCERVYSQTTQCQAEVHSRLLLLTLTGSSVDSTRCQATYDGRLVGCYNHDFLLGAMISRTFQIRGIGLDAQQLKAVRRKYWGLNTLLDLGEVRLLEIGLWLSISAGAIAACFGWAHSNPSTFQRKNYAVRLLVLLASSFTTGFVGYFFSGFCSWA